MSKNFEDKKWEPLEIQEIVRLRDTAFWAGTFRKGPQGVKLVPLVMRPSVVQVLALDRRERRVWFALQYRPAKRRVVEEWCAGKLKPGEDPTVAASRKLWSELGLRADRYTVIDELEMLASPGYTNERVQFVLADGLRRVMRGRNDRNVRPFSIAWDEIPAMIWQATQPGHVVDCKFLLGLLWLADHLQLSSVESQLSPRPHISTPRQVLQPSDFGGAKGRAVRTEVWRFRRWPIFQKQFEIVAGPPAVVAVIDRNERMLLIEQDRFPVRRTTRELVAGKIDPDEFPGVEDLRTVAAHAVRRETEEETGLQFGEWLFLAQLHASPGWSDEDWLIFVATGDMTMGSKRLEDTDIVARWHENYDPLLDPPNDLKTATAVMLFRWVKRAGGVSTLPQA